MVGIQISHIRSSLLGEIKINWNNGYHPYHNHEAGINMVTSEESIKVVLWRKEEIIETVLYVPERLRGSSVRTQKVTGNYYKRLERSWGSITHVHYDYTI